MGKVLEPFGKRGPGFVRLAGAPEGLGHDLPYYRLFGIQFCGITKRLHSFRHFSAFKEQRAQGGQTGDVAGVAGQRLLEGRHSRFGRTPLDLSCAKLVKEFFQGWGKPDDHWPFILTFALAPYERLPSLYRLGGLTRLHVTSRHAVHCFQIIGLVSKQVLIAQESFLRLVYGQVNLCEVEIQRCHRERMGRFAQ